MAFFPAPPPGSPNMGYFYKNIYAPTNVKRKKKKHFMDIVGGGSGEPGSPGKSGKSELAKSVIKKGKELMESINPVKQTKLYQAQPKKVQRIIDVVVMATATELWNAIPFQPLPFKSPFGDKVPVGPQLPYPRNPFKGPYFYKKKRKYSRRRRRY